MNTLETTARRDTSQLGKWLRICKVSSIRNFIESGGRPFEFPAPSLTTRHPEPELQTNEKKPSRSYIHAALNTFADSLPLGNAMRRRLTREGFSDDELAAAKIREVPNETTNLILTFELSKKFNLAGVPGFVRTRFDGWRLNIFPRSFGIVTAERDDHGYIRSLKLFRSFSDAGFRIK